MQEETKIEGELKPLKEGYSKVDQTLTRNINQLNIWDELTALVAYSV